MFRSKILLTSATTLILAAASWGLANQVLAETVSKLPEAEQTAISSLVGEWNLVKGDAKDCSASLLIKNEGGIVGIRGANSFEQTPTNTLSYGAVNLNILDKNGSVDKSVFDGGEQATKTWSYLDPQDGFVYFVKKKYNRIVFVTTAEIQNEGFAFKRLENGILYVFHRFENPKLTDKSQCYYEQTAPGTFIP
jgi:hypothetical protein